jgi:FkbM family methyltransferase
MQRRRFVIGFAVVVLLIAAAMIVNPAARTKGYFAVEREWAVHWPLTRGAALPTRFRWLVRPTAPAWVQVEPGVTMLLDPEDYVSREILRTGAWERPSWDAMRLHLSNGSVFVDVGAHIGYYSLKAAAVVGSAGRVVAVEPNPPTVRELDDNIRASGATAVISVQPVACSDAETTVDLYAAPRVNTGQASLSKANASQGGEVVADYRVRARPLDDIVRETGVSRVDVVKIDVEGAEMLVLKGSVATLARFHPVLMVELIDPQLRAMGSSKAEVVGWLLDHGYSPGGVFQDNVEFTSTATAR